MSKKNKALAVLAYGQSNADGNNSGPRPNSPLLDDKRVMTLSIGRGLRGHSYDAEGQRIESHGVFHDGGRRLGRAELDVTMPVADHSVEHAFLLHAAGAKIVSKENLAHVYVRSSNKGGCRLVGPEGKSGLTGIYKLGDGTRSPIMTALIDDACQIIDAAKKVGEKIKTIYIAFISGDADRNTDANLYTQNFMKAKAEIDDALKAKGVRTYWFFTQAAGTSVASSGNAWTSRAATLQLIHKKMRNARFLGPLYPYEMQDLIHHNAIGKSLIGELLGIAVNEINAKRDWQTPVPRSWMFINENTIGIDVTSPEDLVLMEGNSLPYHGFTIESREGISISSVKVRNGKAIEITLNAAPSKDLHLAYAFSRSTSDDVNENENMPYYGGSVHTSWTAQSEIVEGKLLRKWLPGFRVLISPAIGKGKI